jgi:hypothetical protein
MEATRKCQSIRYFFNEEGHTCIECATPEKCPRKINKPPAGTIAASCWKVTT